MGRRETAVVTKELERLAYFQSAESDSVIRLPERFKDADAFKNDLWRPDLVSIVGAAVLFGVFLVWFGLWPVALFFLVPGGVFGALLLNDTVTYFLWNREDKPKYHERYRWERNKALADTRAKLVVAQKVRICELADQPGVFEQLPAHIRKQITGFTNEKRVKAHSVNVESYLIQSYDDEDE